MSLLPELVSVPAGLYTFPEIADRLSTPSSRVELGPDLEDRAAVIYLKERPQNEAVTRAARALGLSVEMTASGLRLIRDPKVADWEHGLQDQYVADLGRLLDANVKGFREALDLTPERSQELRDRLDTLRSIQNPTRQETAEKVATDRLLMQRTEIEQESKGATLRILVDNIGRPDRTAMTVGNFFPITKLNLPDAQIREFSRVLDPNGNANFTVRVVVIGTGIQALIHRVSEDGKVVELWGNVAGFITGTDRYADQVFLGSKASVPIPNLGLGAEARAWLTAHRKATVSLTRSEIGEDKIAAGRSDDNLSAVMLKWCRQKDRELAMELCPADESRIFPQDVPPSGDLPVALALSKCDWLLEDVDGVLVVRNPLRFLREPGRKPLAAYARLARASYGAFWPNDRILNPPELFEVPTFADLSDYYRAAWSKPVVIAGSVYIPYSSHYYGIPLQTIRMNHALTYLYASLSQAERRQILAQPSGIRTYPLDTFPDAVRRRFTELLEQEIPVDRGLNASSRLFVRWRSTNSPGERIVSLYVGNKDVRYMQTIDGRLQEAELAADLMYPWVFRDKVGKP